MPVLLSLARGPRPVVNTWTRFWAQLIDLTGLGHAARLIIPTGFVAL